PEGTTLLNYDEALIVNNLRRNPWVKDVKLSREFPDRLRVEITERTVTSIVMMNSGSVTWCMGDDDVWIEPVKIVAGEGQSIIEAALAYVSGSETLVITDVPQTVNPVAGTVAEDEVFEAIRAYRTELSKDFWDQIVSINASSIEGISCVLKSGIEISLGVPSNIETKEAVIDQLMAKYPNRLTYINVRVPSNPSYRMVDTESVEGGSGATGDISAATPSATTEPTKTQGEQNVSSGSESAEGTAEATESYDEWTDTSDEWTDGSGEWTEGYDDYADTYGEWTEGYDESTETYDEWTEGY
ncbi:MAG: FtsQ-type POTRA domain-containing protein, partial [Atopobiaceae bacterium]|nr:FtsQ-type POTRA domain-containing protein [Atopobiaceae bacterium]